MQGTLQCLWMLPLSPLVALKPAGMKEGMGWPASRGGVYWFPWATLTNYHKFGGLKQYIRILLQLWRSEVWSQSHWDEIKVSLLPEAPGESSYLVLSSF